jgi:5-oxoprolinase (ATP-hydrolysing)
MPINTRFVAWVTFEGWVNNVFFYQCLLPVFSVQEGDVLLSNHPQLAGGSHLPDITVITPVFSGGKVVFFVASRGHHADIGGISPGSMPPNSKVLAEEGAAVVSFKLVKDGAFQVSTAPLVEHGHP